MYGSPTHGLRKHLWNTLNNQKLDLEGPWLAAGDFNAVVSPTEVSEGSNFSQQRCAGFTEWIFNQGLVDLGYFGSRFTWRRGNQKDKFKGARLDRALCNLDWRIRFEGASVEHLATSHSDHVPILIRTDKAFERRGEEKFRFQAAWLMDESFSETVARHWSANADLADNVRHITTSLKDWNKEHFGSVGRKKRRVLARIQGVQKELSISRRPGLFKLEKKLQKELDDILKQEEMIWYQKSREEWIVSGDRNTKYYHTSTVINRSRKKIGALKNDNDELITEKDQIKTMITDYFMRLFEKDSSCNMSSALKGKFPPLGEDIKNAMEKPVEIDEIKQAIFDMAPFKAPGPDGLHAAFY